MKAFNIRQSLFFVFLTIIMAGNAHATRREVHILGVNDMHATIWNVPQLAAIADSLRQLYPTLLIFSAGDNRTGDPINDRYDIPAYPMVALMNQIGFNASALGNHEFDVQSLARLTDLANFRYLCANVFADPASGVKALPCQKFDVDGLTVGVIGAIQLSPEGLPSSHPDNLRGLSFKPAAEVLGDYEGMSRECDITILLSHLGYEDDRDMARSFPWLDLIIGGHTHVQLKGDETTNGVLITQNRNKLKYATHITLVVDNGHVVEKHSEYINVEAFNSRNRIVEEMVRCFNDNPFFRRVVAQAAKPFDIREELGCMMCDAFMEACQADIGVENPGGVRLDRHTTGDITVRDVYEMDPFDNHAVVLNLTGNELLHMMLSYCHNRVNSFPFVGGIKCRIITDEANPRVIKQVQMFTPDGKRLDMKRRYRVVTNNYVTATSEIPEGSAEMLPLLTTDALLQFLERHATVDYNGVRRLEIVE